MTRAYSNSVYSLNEKRKKKKTLYMVETLIGEGKGMKEKVPVDVVVVGILYTARHKVPIEVDTVGILWMAQYNVFANWDCGNTGYGQIDVIPPSEAKGAS
ncbi:hypothetical protein Tco_0013720 [Tanacetum coccineum]